MQDLLNEIERALRARGWSARQASLAAVGTPELIRDMRRGRVPSVARVRALCAVLDLEFYIGPHRPGMAVDRYRLERALGVAERGLEMKGRAMSHAEKARFVSAIYALIGEENKTENTDSIIRLIEALSET